MSKFTEKQWETAIRRARELYLKMDEHRFEVAQICIDACDIVHGGRADNRFTIVRFAKAIGINRKTLSEWTRIKRAVVDKLTIADQNSVKKLPYDIVRRVADKVQLKTSNKDVRRLFAEELGKDPVTLRFAKYKKVMMTVVYNLKRSSHLAEVPDNDLAELVSIASLIKNLGAIELEFREKNGGKPQFVSLVEKEARARTDVRAILDEPT